MRRLRKDRADGRQQVGKAWQLGRPDRLAAGPGVEKMMSEVQQLRCDAATAADACTTKLSTTNAPLPDSGSTPTLSKTPKSHCGCFEPRSHVPLPCI